MRHISWATFECGLSLFARLLNSVYELHNIKFNSAWWLLYSRFCFISKFWMESSVFIRTANRIHYSKLFVNWLITFRYLSNESCSYKTFTRDISIAYFFSDYFFFLKPMFTQLSIECALTVNMLCHQQQNLMREFSIKVKWRKITVIINARASDLKIIAATTPNIESCVIHIFWPR